MSAGAHPPRVDPWTIVRVLAGVAVVPVLPFVSAVLWRAGRPVLGIAIVLNLAGYLVFFKAAIGWGVILLASASMWSMGGSALEGWRRSGPRLRRESPRKTRIGSTAGVDEAVSPGQRGG
jgi:hypothetical protein